MTFKCPSIKIFLIDVKLWKMKMTDSFYFILFIIHQFPIFPYMCICKLLYFFLKLDLFFFKWKKKIFSIFQLLTLVPNKKECFLAWTFYNNLSVAFEYWIQLIEMFENWLSATIFEKFPNFNYWKWCSKYISW